MKISVIGAGYVGLVTSACLSLDHEVTCIDVDPRKVAELNAGGCPIYEPRLRETIDKGNIEFTQDLGSLDRSDVIFICVGTPCYKGQCDIRQVLAAADDIYRSTKSSKTVVIKSTVVPGTNDKVLDVLNAGVICHKCVSNPEFLREGSAVEDFLHPDRVVIGARESESYDLLEQVYLWHDCFIHMDVVSAEMAKYACNCALATKISFINEISNLCEVTGANVNKVRKVMGTDPRIGSSFYEQGIGYGGSCFPKDVEALIEHGRWLGCPTPLLESVCDVNDNQYTGCLTKLEKYLWLKDSRVAVWGVSFKPETDDIRHSPAVEIIKELLGSGANVRVHDVVANPNLYAELRSWSKKTGISIATVEYYEETDPCEMTKGSDALVIATAWRQYTKAKVSEIEPQVIVDCRGVLNGREAIKQGKCYACFGNPNNS